MAKNIILVVNHQASWHRYVVPRRPIERLLRFSPPSIATRVEIGNVTYNAQSSPRRCVIDLARPRRPPARDRSLSVCFVWSDAFAMAPSKYDRARLAFVCPGLSSAVRLPGATRIAPATQMCTQVTAPSCDVYNNYKCNETGKSFPMRKESESAEFKTWILSPFCQLPSDSIRSLITGQEAIAVKRRDARLATASLGGLGACGRSVLEIVLRRQVLGRCVIDRD